MSTEHDDIPAPPNSDEHEAQDQPQHPSPQDPQNFQHQHADPPHQSPEPEQPKSESEDLQEPEPSLDLGANLQPLCAKHKIDASNICLVENCPFALNCVLCTAEHDRMHRFPDLNYSLALILNKNLVDQLFDRKSFNEAALKKKIKTMLQERQLDFGRECMRIEEMLIERLENESHEFMLQKVRNVLDQTRDDFAERPDSFTALKELCAVFNDFLLLKKSDQVPTAEEELAVYQQYLNDFGNTTKLNAKYLKNKIFHKPETSDLEPVSNTKPGQISQLSEQRKSQLSTALVQARQKQLPFDFRPEFGNQAAVVENNPPMFQSHQNTPHNTQFQQIQNRIPIIQSQNVQATQPPQEQFRRSEQPRNTPPPDFNQVIRLQSQPNPQQSAVYSNKFLKRNAPVPHAPKPISRSVPRNPERERSHTPPPQQPRGRSPMPSTGQNRMYQVNSVPYGEVVEGNINVRGVSPGPRKIKRIRISVNDVGKKPRKSHPEFRIKTETDSRLRDLERTPRSEITDFPTHGSQQRDLEGTFPMIVPPAQPLQVLNKTAQGPLYPQNMKDSHTPVHNKHTQPPINSTILSTPGHQNYVLSSLFPQRPTLQLLYRASVHGDSCEAFHSKCDNQGATLTLVKSRRKGRVFGGFIEKSWSPDMGKDPEFTDSFLFSLDEGLKFGLTGKNNKNGGCYFANKGPVFGKYNVQSGDKIYYNYDLCLGLTEQSGKTSFSCSFLGVSFGGSSGKQGTTPKDFSEILARENYFQLADLEVFRVTF